MCVFTQNTKITTAAKVAVGLEASRKFYQFGSVVGKLRGHHRLFFVERLTLTI